MRLLVEERDADDGWWALTYPPNAPQIDGIAELRLETADRATGYWTTRSERDPGLNARTAALYVRADPSDLEVLDGENEEQRAQLIAQRLRESKSAANAF
jgi:hypothetical protein